MRASPAVFETERITLAQRALANRPDLVDYFKAQSHAHTFEGLTVELLRYEHLSLQMV